MCNCSQAHSLVYLLFHNHIINKKLTLALALPRVGCTSGGGGVLKGGGSWGGWSWINVNIYKTLSLKSFSSYSLGLKDLHYIRLKSLNFKWGTHNELCMYLITKLSHSASKFIDMYILFQHVNVANNIKCNQLGENRCSTFWQSYCLQLLKIYLLKWLISMALWIKTHFSCHIWKNNNNNGMPFVHTKQGMFRIINDQTEKKNSRTNKLMLISLNLTWTNYSCICWLINLYLSLSQLNFIDKLQGHLSVNIFNFKKGSLIESLIIFIRILVKIK